MKRNQVLKLRDPPNEFVDQAINAGIMAGLGFFTTLAALSIVQIKADPWTSLAAAGISAGLQFFISLAAQRGLYKKPETSSRGESSPT